MRIEDQLKQIRKKYLSVKPPQDLEQYGWLALRKEIEAQEGRRFKVLPAFARSFTFMTIAVVILGAVLVGLVQASQGSLPGDSLYPLKRFSETAVIIVSGDKQIRVEKRAEDVIGVAEEKKDAVLLKEAIKEYQKAVLETKQEIDKSGKSGERQQFYQELEREESEFREASKSGPSLKDDLEEAIEVSKKGRNGGDGQEENEEDREGENSGRR